ncbi:leucine-rich repeat-containing protein 15 [Anabrus simplex]|uniref:leucine-rich repeat-containing protein 15 n=1 Tax=Anabrus simplex TaxID=316456 RepID=UPI0034DCEF71
MDNLRRRRKEIMRWRKDSFILVLVVVLQLVTSVHASFCDRYYDEQLIMVYNYQNTLTTDCRGRSLESIPKYLDPDTKHLLISSNNIGKLNNSIFEYLHLTGLLTLDLRDNDIKYVQESAFQGLVDLEILSLDNNGITSLSPNILKDCSKLRHLGLRGNPIQIPDSEHFLNIRGLETLDLSDCNLNVLPKALLLDSSKLQLLKLSSNKLINLNTEEFKNLRRLEVDYNRISSLNQHTFHSNTDIVFLDLSGNVLSMVKHEPIVYSNSLQYLYLNKCGIVEITAKHFLNLTNVEELYMDWNFLTVIRNDSFLYLENVRVLSLRYNKIRYLEPHIFKTNVRLSQIDLSGNHLSLGGTPFLELPSLTKLSLSSCNIGNLNHSAIFVGIGNLRSLSLASNNLEDVDVDALDILKSLKYLNMSDNPLKCNRMLRMVWKWCERNYIVCSAECRSPQGDWNMVRYLKFSDSENIKKTSVEVTEESSLILLAIRCFIPFGAMALLIGIVFLTRRLIKFVILKHHHYNSHYSYESDDSEQECTMTTEVGSGKSPNHERSAHNQPQG